MRYRLSIPTATELHSILEYHDGCLYWKVTAHGKPTDERIRAGYLNRVSGYRGITINGTTYAEHRIIWRMFHPRGPMPFVLDHIDGNRSHNRIENLRRYTESGNQNNRHLGMAPKVRSSGRLKRLLQTKESANVRPHQRR